MIYKILVLLSIVFVLTGCTTIPVSNNDATAVLRERIFDNRYSQPTPMTGEVIVKRDKGFVGSFCMTKLFINGDEIAGLLESEKIVLYLTAGYYVFSIESVRCAGGIVELETNIKAGSSKTYRIGWGDNGDFRFHITAF